MAYRTYREWFIGNLRQASYHDDFDNIISHEILSQNHQYSITEEIEEMGKQKGMVFGQLCSIEQIENKCLLHYFVVIVKHDFSTNTSFPADTRYKLLAEEVFTLKEEDAIGFYTKQDTKEQLPIQTPQALWHFLTDRIDLYKKTYLDLIKKL